MWKIIQPAGPDGRGGVGVTRNKHFPPPFFTTVSGYRRGTYALVPSRTCFSSTSQVVLSSQSRRYLSGRTHTVQAATDSLVGSDTAGDPNSHDMNASQRKAAGCFKRQVNLLRSLDRFSTPLPQLEPEVGPKTTVVAFHTVGREFWHMCSLSILGNRPAKRSRSCFRCSADWSKHFVKPAILCRGR